MPRPWKHLSDTDWRTREVALSNRVYPVVIKVFEAMEAASELVGNGHHAAQDAVEAVLKVMREHRPPKPEAP